MSVTLSSQGSWGHSKYFLWSAVTVRLVPRYMLEQARLVHWLLCGRSIGMSEVVAVYAGVLHAAV